MERAGDILKRMIPASTSSASTDRSSSTEVEPPPAPAVAPCPICDGVGYVRRDVPYGHPDFGRPVPCQCQEAIATEHRIARLLELSNLGPLRRLTFDNLLEEGRLGGDPAKRERFRRAYAAARTFASSPDGWLVLVGPSGCGKTHLAAAIANYQIQQGNRVFFAVVPDLLDHLRTTYHPESPLTYDDLFTEVRNCPLLILDDLGTQRNTPWAEEKLFQIINHRYNARLPTVITTNCALDELNERVRTRLTDTAICHVVVVEARESDIIHRLGNIEFLGKMTFASFDLKRQGCTAEQLDNLNRAYRAARDFADQPQGWLVLQGGFGSGKTHLAAAIANERSRRHEPVLFVVVPDLLDYLRSTYSPESAVSYDEVFEILRTAPLLILDDLGAQAATPWAREKLFQLVNHRYVAELPTVMTTNCALSELEPRLASRLADVRLSLPFVVLAPDYRSDIAVGSRPRVAGRPTRRAGPGGRS